VDEFNKKGLILGIELDGDQLETEDDEILGE
jgi:hypothetical protein